MHRPPRGPGQDPSMPFRYARAGAFALGAIACAPAAQAQDAVPLGSVIVTAAGGREDPTVAAVRERLSETPGSVGVVAREAYASRFATGAPDVLRDTPGVFAQRKW